MSIIEDPRIHAELQISTACKKPADIDVLMVVHNQPELTLNTIESLRATTPNYHLYVYDNGSDKETIDILENTDFRGGKLVRGVGNIGFLKPNNILAAMGTSPYMVLLNNDVYCLQGWWEPLIGCLQHYNDVGAVGYLGGYLNSQGIGTAPAWGYDVDYISGWCLGLRRKDYEKFGLFDEKHLEFAYCEDADFCFRLREAGLTTYAFSLNLVWHKGHATSLSIDPEFLSGPFARNHEYMKGRWQKYLGRSLKNYPCTRPC